MADDEGDSDDARTLRPMQAAAYAAVRCDADDRQGAGTTVPLHHPPGAGLRARAMQALGAQRTSNPDGWVC